MRAVNDVYKSFNTNQVPLAILDLQIPTESVDINVSPDKRTIMVHSEANLVEALRVSICVELIANFQKSLNEFFQPTRSSYAVGGASHTIKLTQKDADVDEEDEEAEEPLPVLSHCSQPSRVPELVESEGEEEVDELDDSPDPVSRPSRPSSSRNGLRRPSPPPPRFMQQTLDTTTASWSPKGTANEGSSSLSLSSRAPATGRDARTNLRNRLATFARQGSRPSAPDDDSDDEIGNVQPSERIQPTRKRAASPEEQGGLAEAERREVEEEPLEPDEAPPIVTNGRPSLNLTPRPLAAESMEDEPLAAEDEPMQPEATVSAAAEETVVVEVEETMVMDNDAVAVETQALLDARAPAIRSPSPAIEQTDLQREAVRMDVDEEPIPDGYRNEIQTSAPTGHATLRFDLERLQNRFAARQRRRATNPANSRNAFTAMREGAATNAAGLGNRDAEAAEEALARVINKADFARMEVLGQFNKGFIIARLKGHAGEGSVSGSDDLFIVDQHASDEKYNFETLQRTTVIKAQALIKCVEHSGDPLTSRPRAMQLTAADELVAMENLDALKANGFEVAVNEDAPPGRGERVSLKAMPVSKETAFDFHG